MNKFLALTAVLAAASSGVSGAKWPHLRHTFGAPGFGGASPLPRTQAELDKEGWVQVSSCEDPSSK